MAHLTLQEVIDRINTNYPARTEQRISWTLDRHPSHRPEAYVPRIARIIVGMLVRPAAGAASTELPKMTRA